MTYCPVTILIDMYTGQFREKQCRVLKHWQDYDFHSHLSVAAKTSLIW